MGLITILNLTPILACGNIGITTGDIVLILLIAASWLAAFYLCFASFVFIFRASWMASFRLIHGTILIFYIGLAIFLFNLQSIITDNNKAGSIGIILTIAIPLIVIGHFIYLLIYWRRFMKSKKI